MLQSVSEWVNNYLNDFLGLTSTLYVLCSKVKLAMDTHLVFLQLDTKEKKKTMCNFLPVIFFLGFSSP